MSDEFDLRASDLGTEDFDAFYRQGTPPWQIDRPQPAFLALRDAGLVRGSVLDVGCGTGDHALMAAADGFAAVGLDGSSTAIEMARARAEERGLEVEFVVGNALDLAAVVRGPFDTIIDSALFHVFDDSDRAAYVAGLAEVLAPGGHYLMLCFSDQVPGEVGPRRISEAEIRATFADGWQVESVERTEMIVTEAAVPALVAVIQKSE